MKKKVFCVGFHKTGTTSLAAALRELDYQVAGPYGINDADIRRNAIPRAHKLVDQYDAFQDNPWPLIYREMDVRYPDSKFVLLLRDSESWIKSQVNYFGSKESEMRKWIYGIGCPEGNEELYVKRMEEHNQEVQNYFQGRANDLLVMNLAEGDGWDKLCPFLGVATPTIAFPHANRGRSEKVKRGGILGPLKNYLSRMLSAK